MARPHVNFFDSKELWDVFVDGSSFHRQYSSKRKPHFDDFLRKLDKEVIMWKKLLTVPESVRSIGYTFFNPIVRDIPTWVVAVPERFTNIVKDFRLCYAHLLDTLNNMDPNTVLAVYNVRMALVSLHILLGETILIKNKDYQRWTDMIELRVPDSTFKLCHLVNFNFINVYAVEPCSQDYKVLMQESEYAATYWKKCIPSTLWKRNIYCQEKEIIDFMKFTPAVQRLVVTLVGIFVQLNLTYKECYYAERHRQKFDPYLPRKLLREITTLVHHFKFYYDDYTTYSSYVRKTANNNDIASIETPAKKAKTLAEEHLRLLQ